MYLLPIISGHINIILPKGIHNLLFIRSQIITIFCNNIIYCCSNFLYYSNCATLSFCPLANLDNLLPFVHLPKNERKIHKAHALRQNIEIEIVRIYFSNEVDDMWETPCPPQHPLETRNKNFKFFCCSVTIPQKQIGETPELHDRFTGIIPNDNNAKIG
jgi:hypothetical protein